MPDTFVTLEYLGVEKSLDGWGIAQAGAVTTQTNMRPDTFRCSVPVASINDAPIFPFEALIKVRSGRTGGPSVFAGGMVDFVGYRLDPVHDGRPEYEGVHYEFANAWYLLENTPFQQSAANYVATSGAVGFQFQTSLVLFSKISEGNAVDPREQVAQLPSFLIPIDSGWQIEQILKHALAMYATQSIAAPFQIGSITPDLNLPMWPCQEVNCAAAIQKCLELSPDAGVSFDYSTAPPTINVGAGGTAVTLAIADGVEHKTLRISPKPTLIPSVVIIYFRITGSFTVDGAESTYVVYSRQKWGPGGENTGPEGGVRALLQTIDLAGFSSTQLSQEIRTLPFNVGDFLHTDAGQVAVRSFWADNIPWMKPLTCRRMSFFDTTIYDAETNAILAYQSQVPIFVAAWPRWIKDGAVAPWMRTANGSPVVSKRIKVTSRVYYARYETVGSGETDTSGTEMTHEQTITPPYTNAQMISFDCTVTNAISSIYTQTNSTAGEDIPLGLAEKVWNSIGHLQYEGEHVKVKQEAFESDAAKRLTLANTLNLSGGHADWLTMEAVLQSITKDYGSGEMSVSFGPATHLNSGDLNALFQFNRTRRVTQNVSVRQTGQV